MLPGGPCGQLRLVLSGAYIEVEGEDGNFIDATPGYAEAPARVDGTQAGNSGLWVMHPTITAARMN